MQQTQARVNFYALLSRLLLQEVDRELLCVIKEDKNIFEYFPTLMEWQPLRELEEQQLIDEHFNPDFVNLSLLHLIPYESFYTREDQMIETGGANPVTDFYSAYDFMVDYEKARTVSSDHIGIEFEFMHMLCSAQLSALQGGDSEATKALQEVQRDFLNKHLLRWAPLYLINMKYEARTPLYYDVADLALEFLLSDNEYLAASIEG